MKISEVGPLVPLMQTLAWIGLIIFLVIRYGNFLSKVLKNIEERIEGGSSFKLGQFEFGQEIEPQSNESQKAKAEEETQEYLDANMATIESMEAERPRIKSDSIQAEDLVLRAIQEESTEFIERHAKISPELQVDGVLERNGHYTLIEVKLVTNASVYGIAQMAIAKLTAPIVKNSWPGVNVLICLVFNDSDATSAESIALDLLVRRTPIATEVRIFRLDALREKFGIEESL